MTFTEDFRKQRENGVGNWLIRQAKPEDFLQIAALDRIAWLDTGEPFIADGEHAWRVWCEYGTVLLADATQGTETAAGAALMFPTNQQEIFLHKIMVHPEWRGQGMGTALMNHALQLADRPVLLTVNPENAAAVKLYENFGFQRHRYIKGYYRPHEHRLLMRYVPGDAADAPAGQ